MAGQTKLFQRAGSPLIQGHSKRERRFWTEWSLACLPAALVIYAALGVVTLLGGAGSSSVSLGLTQSVVRWLARPAGGIAAMLVACALGVGFARAMGWRRAWLAGAVLGAVVGIVVMAYSWRFI